MFWYILLAILLIGLGLFMALKPDTWWEITEAWKSKDADGPSDLYLWRVRTGGILLIVCMVILVIILIAVS